MDESMVPPDGDHSKCGLSQGIHDCITVGQGELDSHGFWQHGCPTCARRIEKEHPDFGPVWPHTKEQLEKIFPSAISTHKD